MTITKTIFDVLEENPTFQFEDAKKAGYTDKEIIAFLSKNEKLDDFTPDSFEIREISWDRRIENFMSDHPISFWSITVIIIVFLTWGSIFYIWKLIKLSLYQVVYTIAKAIKDAENSKEIK